MPRIKILSHPIRIAELKLEDLSEDFKTNLPDKAHRQEIKQLRRLRQQLI